MRTIAAFFDSSKQASGAFEALLQRGFLRRQLSLLAHADSHLEIAAQHDVVELDQAPERARNGAVLGGLSALLVSMVAVMLPGIGPFLVLGPLATALVSTGLGVAAGGMLGGLTRLGVPHERAELYVEGLRRGGTLLLVECPVPRVDEAVGLLQRHGAIDLGERTELYRTSRYRQVDPSTIPYAHDQGALDHAMRQELLGPQSVPPPSSRARSSSAGLPPSARVLAPWLWLP